MTVAQAKGQARSSTRAGAQALSLLAVPINVEVLQALAKQNMSLVDLRRAVGSPPQTTMRCYLRTLREIDVLTKRRRDDFPGVVDYELTDTGRDLLVVAEVLQAWLAEAPEGPLALGSPAAKSAIKALVEGWATNMVRALAAKPLSLTELDRLIANLSYPSLERRLAAMRLAGQVEARPGPGRSTPYALTDWLRRAVAPLGAAARWERLHTAEGTAPITRVDAEAAFLLAVPLLDLPANLSGICRLGVEVRNGSGQRLAGVLVGVKQGRIASYASQVRGDATAWAHGSGSAWLRAIIEHDVSRLEVGGDRRLADALLDGLHSALFSPGRAA